MVPRMNARGLPSVDAVAFISAAKTSARCGLGLPDCEAVLKGTTFLEMMKSLLPTVRNGETSNTVWKRSF